MDVLAKGAITVGLKVLLTPPRNLLTMAGPTRRSDRLTPTGDPGSERVAERRCRPRMHLYSFIGSPDRDEEGQGLAEYALILALIAIIAIIALVFLGGQINTILSSTGNSI